jgi:GTP-binding protein Era
MPTPAGQRCGLIAIVGKPNVGKSTLLNALVGQKISITSRKAQTTRHRITGMHTQGATQFVFVDTPGFQTRHNNALNRSLNKTVMGAVGDVDLILFVVEAGMFNQADAKVLALFDSNIPTLLVANKFDQIHRRGDIAPWLQEMQQRPCFCRICAHVGQKCQRHPTLVRHLRKIPARASLVVCRRRADRPQ